MTCGQDGDGELTLDEVLGGAHLLDLSQEAARVLFEELDTEKKVSIQIHTYLVPGIMHHAIFAMIMLFVVAVMDPNH